MDAINGVAASINGSIAYLKDNAWPIAFLLAMWFYVRPQVMTAMANKKAERSPQQVKNTNQDLRRVRQLQQLQVEQDAKLNAKALEERKAERLAEEKAQAKKNKVVVNKTKSGSSSLSMDTFTTPSYKPQKRSTRRGWG